MQQKERSGPSGKSRNLDDIESILLIGFSTESFPLNTSLSNKVRVMSKRFRMFQTAFGPFSRPSIQEFSPNVRYYFLPKQWPLFIKILALAAISFFLLARHRKLRTIYCQDPVMTGFIGALLKRVPGFSDRTLIVGIHGNWEQGYLMYGKKGKLSHLRLGVFRSISRFSFRSAHLIRSCNRFYMRRAEEIIGRHAEFFILPGFVDVDFLQEGGIELSRQELAPFNPTILFCSALESLKGLKFLIKAINILKNDFKEVGLVVLGNGSERRSLEAFTLRLFGSDNKRIVFQGKVSYHEVREYLRACDIVVLPSLSEAVGTSLIEAMSLSKPVVASNVEGISEFVRNGYNGILIPPGDSLAIAAAISTICRSPNLANKLGSCGRTLILGSYPFGDRYAVAFSKMVRRGHLLKASRVT